MSLFGLSTAVAGVRAGKHSCDNAATNDVTNTNECTVHLQLQQMAAAVSACQRLAAQNRHQTSVPDPLKAVQEGLQITQQQLQRLLQQQQPCGPAAHQQQNGQQAHSSSSTTTTSSSSCAARVLQDLLQLAVGDVSLLSAAPSDVHHHSTSSSSSTTSCTTSGTASIGCNQLECVAATTTTATIAAPFWYPDTVHRSAKQQQIWGDAAVQAVQLFNLHDLLAGGSSTLHQALLLQPQLLNHLLEALAAAVLQPVLPNLAASTAPCSRSKNPVPSSSDISSSGGEESAVGGSCCSIATALANSKLPWTELPDILAASPPLMLKASGTLLSWLEVSSHLQLQQLSSLILRPAWKRMAAAAEAAAAAAAERPQNVAQLMAGKPLTPGTAVHLKSALNSTSCNSITTPHCLAAGAFQLVCPEAWQQQLVQQLVQEPSVEGLGKLLQLLPGFCANDSCCAVDAEQQRQPVDLADVSGDSVMATEIQGWPAADEWRSSWWQRDRRQYHLQRQQQQLQQQQQQCPASDTGADSNKQSRTPNPKACQRVQQGADLLLVLAAWKLVVQHRCWYEFACYILVKRSITALQHQQQQQQPSSALVSLGSMQCASSFIAWVNQPIDTYMQHKLHQQLLAPVNNTGSAQPAEAEGDRASCTSFTHLCNHLLRGWKSALSGTLVDKPAEHPHTAAAAAAEAAGAAPVSTAAGAHASGNTAGANSGAAGAGGSAAGATSLHCVVAVDLPVAILQQLQLLTQCAPQELLQLCFPAILSNLPQQLQQRPQQMDPTAGTRVHAASAVEHSQPAGAASQESQSLEQTLEAATVGRSVLCAALTAVDAVSGAAVELFNAALKCNTQPVSFQGDIGAAQQQSQQLDCTVWLSRQWAAEVLTAPSFADSAYGLAGSHLQGKAAANRSARFMQVAQKLLQNSTACEKLLKARAGMQ